MFECPPLILMAVDVDLRSEDRSPQPRFEIFRAENADLAGNDKPPALFAR